jgi:hypothetical protein
MGSERRRAERFDIGLRIEFDSGSGLTRDVSGLGVFFRTDVAFSAGDEISFVMVVPDAVNVKCRGKIVRVDQKDGMYGVAATIDSYSLAGETSGESTAHLVINELRKHHG